MSEPLSTADKLWAAGALLPAQWFAALRSQRPHAPERMLWLSVLEDAIRCVQVCPPEFISDATRRSKNDEKNRVLFADLPINRGNLPIEKGGDANGGNAPSRFDNATPVVVASDDGRPASTNRRRRYGLEARAWFDSDEMCLGSFRWLCDALDIDAGYLRAGIAEGATLKRRLPVSADANNRIVSPRPRVRHRQRA